MDTYRSVYQHFLIPLRSTKCLVGELTLHKYFLLILFILAMPTSALAHHGTTGQFDRATFLQVSGVVTDLAFVNPHAYVYFDVTDKDGQVMDWHCEMRAATVLQRSGWTKEMFANGTHLDILGNPSHREPTGCYIETISFNGGPAIQRYDQLEENQIAADTNRPLLTETGRPYIGGDWAAKQNLPSEGEIDPSFGQLRVPGPTLTPAGAAALEANQNIPGDNITGRLDCMPRDVLNDWIYNESPNRIIQTDDKITLQYGFMDTVKVVHMNMSAHSENITPSWIGHSIGWWEGDVLVVDTIGYTMAVGRGNGNFHSKQLHSVERFSLDTDNWELNRSYIADDSLFWENQISSSDTVYLSALPYAPYNCDDRAVE
jgi:hypothetical protein